MKIFEAISNGAALISSNYPRLLTNKGHALVLRLDNMTYNKTSKVRMNNPEVINTNDEEQPSKRRKDAHFPSSGNQVLCSDVPNDSYSINLWDSAFETDTDPLVPSCSCVACKHHTRAYIHHLLLSKV